MPDIELRALGKPSTTCSGATALAYKTLENGVQIQKNLIAFKKTLLRNESSRLSKLGVYPSEEKAWLGRFGMLKSRHY